MDYRNWQAQMSDIPGAPEHVSYQAYNTRVKYLTHDGFLNWEIFWLAQHMIGSPGMKAMRVDRRRLIGEARSNDLTPEEYEAEVKQVYRNHNWTFKSGEPNPFEMLEFYKRQIGDPDYPKKYHRRKTSTQKSKREASSGGS